MIQYPNYTSIELFQYYLLNHRNDYKQSKYIAYYINENIASIFYNNTAYHALPISINLYYNLLYQYGHENGNNATINCYAEPFPLNYHEKEGYETTNSFLLSIFIVIAFCFIPASFAYFIIYEKELGFKHLQFISGINTLSYWLAMYVWDYILYLITLLCSIIILLIDNNTDIINNLDVIILSFILYGLSIISLTYLISFIFKKTKSVQIYIFMIYSITGMVLMIVSFILDLLEVNINQKLKFIYRIFPSFCLGETLLKVILVKYDQTISKWDYNISLYNLIYMSCSCIIYFMLVLVVDKYHLNLQLLQKLDYYSSKKSLTNAGIFGPNNLAAVSPSPETSPSPAIQQESLAAANNDDDDVIIEQNKVQELIKKKNSYKGVLVDNIYKQYGSLHKANIMAVNGVSFSVAQGECYGYLGTNGAGKTTTLSILSSKIHPSYGNAYINGYSILNQSNFTRQLIGYCPQFDTLIPLLNAYELLNFFATIKGVKNQIKKQMIQMMINNLNLNQFASKPCGTYSGGNKRKLNVALSLIGNPPVVFLDEPSTGIDPTSRRFMWNFIANTMKKRSVILTTHNMEECEALCNKIGIMVDGQLQCIGTAQHIKDKYGKQYQLNITYKHVLPNTYIQVQQSAKGLKDIKASPQDPEHMPKANEPQDFILYTFPGTIIKELYNNNVKYYVPNSYTFLQIFEILEKYKEQWNINEYQLSQLSLENIFLTFAEQSLRKGEQDQKK